MMATNTTQIYIYIQTMPKRQLFKLAKAFQKVQYFK